MNQKPEISNYLNYRDYLKDFLKFKRTQKMGIRKYSYSDFAAAADLKSPQYLKLVIESKRNLSDDGIEKFAKALGLSKKESEHFSYLVRYNQATEPQERYQHLQKLSYLRSEHTQELKSPHWLKVIVYSICDGIGGAYTLNDFKKLLKDRCKTQALQKCLNEMVEEKALIRLDGGPTQADMFQKAPGQNTLSNDIPLDIIKQIQSDLLFLGLESLFIDDPNKRDLGSFSIALTKSEFENVKFEIRKFRKALLKNLLIQREQGPGEQVYQVQFQVFPVTHSAQSLKPSAAKTQTDKKPLKPEAAL